MGFSAEEYRTMLYNLLPKGRAWTRDSVSTLFNLIHGLATEYSRVDGRSDDLLNERDTRQTLELLADYENDFGLPDDCTPDSPTIQQRRSEVYAKFIEEGGLNPQSYIDLAASLGITITITQYTPFWCGIGMCGDEIGDQTNIFYWKVGIHTDLQFWEFFTCGSSQCGDPLGSDIDSFTLRCLFERYKPAHTILLWEYIGPEFDSSHSSAFDAIPSSDEGYIQGAFSSAYSDAYDLFRG